MVWNDSWVENIDIDPDLIQVIDNANIPLKSNTTAVTPHNKNENNNGHGNGDYSHVAQ